MVGAQTLSASNHNQLSCGFTAKVQTIPAGTVHQTVLYGDNGINDALYRWGDILLNTFPDPATGPKQRTPLDVCTPSNAIVTASAALCYHICGG
jgi:hypothetical protein